MMPASNCDYAQTIYRQVKVDLLARREPCLDILRRAERIDTNRDFPVYQASMAAYQLCDHMVLGARVELWPSR